MRRRSITEWADWTLSARENLVQQERPKHQANASMAHNLQQTCHCVWLALSVWDPTEACAYGADPPCVCQTERSFKALINGLSVAMLLCPCISVSLNKSEQWENVSVHTKCRITNRKKRMHLMHTRLSLRGNAQIQTQTQPGAHSEKVARWTGRHTREQTKTKKTSAELLTGWARLAFATLCIKAYQMLWETIVCQECLFWLTYKLVDQST